MRMPEIVNIRSPQSPLYPFARPSVQAVKFDTMEHDGV
jgi:hypothetical protein